MVESKGGLSQLGDLELILPSQIESKRASLTTSIVSIGSRKDLPLEAVLGMNVYSFWNMTELFENARWYIHRSKSQIKAVINHHYGRDPAHDRIFIHTTAFEDALELLPEIIQLQHPKVDICRFVIPVPGRDYDNRKIREKLNQVGFEPKGLSVTVAQMYWPRPESFIYYDERLKGDDLIDPLTLMFANSARSLYNRNSSIHSFHPEELERGLHAGLIRPDENEYGNNPIAACGRTFPIPVFLEGSIFKMAILRDAVVQKELRDKGRIKYLASSLARKCYSEGVQIIGLDATNEAAQRAVEKLGAQVAEYRVWFAAQRIDGGALVE